MMGIARIPPPWLGRARKRASWYQLLVATATTSTKLSLLRLLGARWSLVAHRRLLEGVHSSPSSHAWSPVDMFGTAPFLASNKPREFDLLSGTLMSKEIITR